LGGLASGAQGVAASSCGTAPGKGGQKQKQNSRSTGHRVSPPPGGGIVFRFGKAAPAGLVFTAAGRGRQGGGFWEDRRVLGGHDHNRAVGCWGVCGGPGPPGHRGRVYWYSLRAAGSSAQRTIAKEGKNEKIAVPKGGGPPTTPGMILPEPGGRGHVRGFVVRDNSSTGPGGGKKTKKLRLFKNGC